MDEGVLRKNLVEAEKLQKRRENPPLFPCDCGSLTSRSEYWGRCGVCNELRCRECLEDDTPERKDRDMWHPPARDICKTCRESTRSDESEE